MAAFNHVQGGHVKKTILLFLSSKRQSRTKVKVVSEKEILVACKDIPSDKNDSMMSESSLK